MSDGDYTFESANAGASLTYPCEAGNVKQGGHAMLKGKPCKIIQISVSKTGKHGHAKCAFVGTDVFTGKKLEDVCPASHNMEVPNVARVEYQLLNLEEDTGNLSVLLENGDTKDDLNLPQETPADVEMVTQMKTAFNEGKDLMVTVLKAMDKEKIVSFKESQL